MLKLFKHLGAKASAIRRTPCLGKLSGDLAEVPEAPAPAPVDHRAYVQADPYAFASAHRRLAWMFRLSVMMCVGSMSLNVMQTAAISELVPLKEVQMGLIRIEPRTDKAEKVDPATLVRVLPVTKDTPGYDIMLDAFVRRFPRLLLEIDSVSQDPRMREANLYSDAEYWKKFIRDQKKQIDQAIESGLNRSIVVESADRISERKGVYRYAVDLVQIDKRNGQLVEPPKKVRAYIAVTARPNTVKPEEAYENAQGFRILDLALKERGNS